MKIQIGGATLEEVSVAEAVALLGNLNNGETKTKRTYKKRDDGRYHKGGWDIAWSKEEDALMEEKILKNFTIREIVGHNFFPKRTRNAVAYRYNKVKKSLLRRRNNPVVLTQKEYLPNQ